MDLNEIQNVWKSRQNNFTTEEQRRLVDHFSRQMRRRRRFQTIWLVHTFVALTIITMVALRAIAVGKAHLEEQWTLMPLLVVPWFFAFHFLRSHLSLPKPTARGDVSVTVSLCAALESNRSEQSRLKRVALLFGIMIPLLALSMKQLHATGKVSSNELISMSVFFASVLLLSAAGIAARYFARLLPQQRRISEALAELTNAIQ
jgi:hypothetical protein